MKPQDCETLIVESTYGNRIQVLPDRNEVLSDLQAWIMATSAKDGAIIGAYSLGKQEVIAANAGGGLLLFLMVASVRTSRKNGVKLEYNTYSNCQKGAVDRNYYNFNYCSKRKKTR